MGFVTPENQWLKENPAAILELIKKAKLPSFIDHQKLCKWVEKSLSSTKQLDFTLIRLIATISWVNRFNIKVR